MLLGSGTRFGPFEVLAPLGAGGMGEVYRARDTRLGREVAIKLLPSGVADDPERSARFEREAKLLASLNHPNIAALYGLEHVEGSHVLVMELVEGDGLDERIARGPIPLDEALAIALQIADALEAAHERGIVHRDLKPANVMVRPDGTVKVLDFGLAKTLEPEGTAADLANSPTLTSPATRQGMILGTAAYMSPEQARGKPVDKRTDVWAFGCVLYEMLTGKRLFAGETVSDLLAAVLRQEIDWSRLPEEAPPALRRLLKRCLERDPNLRLRDMGDAEIEIREAHDPASAAQAASAPFVAGARFHGGRWLAAGAVLLALVPISWLVGRAMPREGEFEHVAFAPKNYRSEAVFAARFLPDGQSIVYSSALEGTTPEVFILRPEFPEPRPMGLRNTQLLAVSSRGELAVLTRPKYVRHRIFEGTLARVQVGVEAPREVLDNVREADWSPDGSSLAVIREVAGKDRLEYPIGKVLFSADGYLSDPRVSPDGQRVAFFQHPIRWDDRGLVAAVDRDGGRTVLSEAYDGLEGLAWSPEGRKVLFSAGEGGGDLVAYSATLAGRRRVALRSLGNTVVHDIAKDGRLLVARDEWRYAIRCKRAGEAAEREYRWLSSDNPRLSVDGEKLVFVDDALPWGPNYAAAFLDLRGTAPVRLGEGVPLGLSPDASLALAVVPTTPGQLVLYPTGAGEPRRLEAGGIEMYGEIGGFLPDGRGVVISGSERGRASRCYVQAIDGGPPRPVTPEGTRDCRVSPDAKFLLGRAEGGRYLLFPLGGGEPRPLAGIESGEDVADWSSDGQSVFSLESYGVPARVDRVELATGKRTRVFDLSPPDRAGVISIPRFTLAHDGAAYAYSYHQVRSQLFLATGLK